MCLIANVQVYRLIPDSVSMVSFPLLVLCGALGAAVCCELIFQKTERVASLILDFLNFEITI